MQIVGYWICPIEIVIDLPYHILFPVSMSGPSLPFLYLTFQRYLSFIIPYDVKRMSTTILPTIVYLWGWGLRGLVFDLTHGKHHHNWVKPDFTEGIAFFTILMRMRYYLKIWGVRVLLRLLLKHLLIIFNITLKSLLGVYNYLIEKSLDNRKSI